MPVRFIVWIIALTLLIGCAAPTLPAAVIPNSTPTFTPTPTMTATATPAASVEEPADQYLIAFASERDNMPGIYVTDLRGRSVHLITREAMKADHPAWSPDGKRLAFTAQQGAHHELFVVDADGTNLVQLTREQGDNFYPTWSPDSQRLAFATNRDGFYQIYAMQADGSHVQRLTDTTVREEKPAWSPDGSRIAFMSTRDGNAEVYVMNADGSDPTRLTDHPASELNPAWSPDGKLIAFNSTRGTGQFGIYVMNDDGSNVRLVVSSGSAWFEKPAWSPDGQLIAFYSNRDGKADVYVIKPNGTRMQRITYQTGWDGQPAWSPTPIAIPTFPCPATKPNGSQPPGEKTISTEYHGNGAVWTVLPADGILYVRRESDGLLSTKLPWWRGVNGTLTIEGHRLDDDGEFSAHVPDGYGSSGFQATGVYFSSEGCWEVQGHVGAAELKFVVDVKADE